MKITLAWIGIGIVFAQAQIVEIPTLGVMTMLVCSAAISGFAGMFRSKRKGESWINAAIDGMCLFVLGLAGALICVSLVLSSDVAPNNAEYLIVGLAGLAGWIGISTWDAALHGLFGAMLQRFVKKMGRKDDE